MEQHQGDVVVPSSGRLMVRRHRARLMLGVAMAAANVVGYATVVLVSGALGPADFGAVAALTALGVITAIPAGALQVVVAGRAHAPREAMTQYALATVVGVASCLVLAAVSPVLASVFDLDSVRPVLWLGLTLVPMTVTGAQQGLLLGAGHLGRLSLLFLTSGVTRLVATLWCVLERPTVDGAFMAWCLATVVTAALGHVLVGDLVRLAVRVDGLRTAAARLGRSSVALLALIVFTSLDTILARHYLTAYESGIYGVASMFAKVIFWGTQFIAMVAVPRLRRRHSPALVLKAYAAIVVVAVPVIAAVAADPGLWLSAVGLDDYADAGSLLIGFAVLGLFWSMTQVSVFIDMGVGRGSMTRVILLGVAVQVTLMAVWLHSSPAQIWLATFVAAVAVTVTTLALMLRGSRTAAAARSDHAA